jgi:hypothetical protein
MTDQVDFGNKKGGGKHSGSRKVNDVEMENNA